MKSTVKFWLPPIELCCEESEVYFQLHEDMSLHLLNNCKLHKRHFISNPISTSKRNIEVRPSKKVAALLSNKTPVTADVFPSS